MILLIFGDSITQGYWDKEGGWADRVRASVLTKDIKNKFSTYHGVHNLGIDGNTTKQVVNRFGHESQARLWPNSEYGIIFAVGTNDTVHTNQTDFLSTPEQYKAELTILLERARKLSDRIAFVNLCPVEESQTNPLPASSTGKCYTNDRIDLFNSVLKEFCDINNAVLIDVHEQFMKHDGLLADGLHPNTKGHQMIADMVLPTVSTWLYK